MTRQRRIFTPKLNAKVSLEAVKESHTMAEFASKHEAHANMISAWKKTLTEGAEGSSKISGAGGCRYR